MRRSVSKYTFPGTDLTIYPDTIIIISTSGMHSDEKYFDLFRPDRFHLDNDITLKKCVYMPFGDGSRACIGE